MLDDIVWAVLPYIRLVRPWQWIKNLLVFAPVFFAVGVLNSSLFSRTLLVFITFCLASSLVYTFNDILDYKQDSLHPKKKNRPIASAEISKKNAILLIFFLAIGIFYLVMLVPSIILPILLYVVINIFYSFKLKHIAVLDIILISLFYILRIIAGGLATEIYVSPWIVVCVFFGSLFVILGKRRAEHTKENRRLVLNDYSSEALNFMLGISASLAIIAYGIWSVTEHNSPYLVYSTIFVVFAIFRILNHIYTNPHEAESPEILVFKDRLILGSFLSWGVYIFWLFYLV
ncbi:MAG: hypothetical protein A3A96_01090 [Candidatus Zambryskibacteria bacterium RIFCSPLOWO2_01_FULL_39_39]|uniref:Decaprenyl-phosphate phosphoribosyltransferase n=1 Tax=Candidatus Zambryskibacteria bacterium RIFCSPLOWO2_01_FULL_39_39 TaxID=1802758 RepID=A0A1G2TYU1_9BACT|nr:MAG: hypothetical protein A2644_04290 [Candidatus Zambryskibacteria bacterium RIFCSPHIGHO2_01_FULL_39_63]OHA95112.1 MAG: hypothetical protein A3B88_03200 [Candidatus Zambryskibacteria bacterium RIFCSPHIGHO2_02_FULL_39_19]OHA98232.1 MAG: hypothetical protein A3F20_04010 [Candidatus Zambryskibacteria bacterium RIFCSPHIGHO2_12_FULL_39_21]OHB02476.1 MAG: hypothetical protein A3A96_01090 [Candidatus Zambryskibacteria bacterium RIFCSPLOWO2_01_FULL_39_39]